MSDKDKELLKKGGIVIFVGLAVMIYFIIGGFGNKIPKHNSSNKSAQHVEQQFDEKHPQKETLPEYMCNVDGVGRVKGVIIPAGIGLAVYEVEEKDYIHYRTMDIQPQGKFILVSIAVANGQKHAVKTKNRFFKLVTADGAEYSDHHKAGTLLDVAGQSSRNGMEINPGMVVSQAIPFDVPPNMNPASLFLEIKWDEKGEPVYLPLQVIRAE